jgi:hypothetical protein
MPSAQSDHRSLRGDPALSAIRPWRDIQGGCWRELLGGAPVIVMQGRVHSYEGYTPREVTFPMRALGALGVRAVVLTNAAGGIAQAGYHVGQLVLAGRSHQYDGLESAHRVRTNRASP